MSYHVTILRTTGGRRSSIEREEVIQAVEAQRRLKIYKSDGRSLEFSALNSNQGGPLLIWENGEIWTKNTDKETLQLMIDLADLLKARVRGDEFETYETPERTYIHPDDKKTIEEARRATVNVARRTHRQQWTIYAVIMGTFVFLGILLAYCSGPS